ncbi:MAG: radical SAM protein, partial [Betaproteobacteria bacterium]|nr:radical SAM protein [Betaproteobacteria bacterium]
GGRDADLAFVEWVNDRYPSFQPAIIPRNDWIGERPSPEAVAAVPDAPCHRWFDISVTATGVVAMCCMDGEAKYPKGDVRTQHLLDIYNQPRLLAFRRDLISRRAAGGPCDRCIYMSY